MPHWLIAYDRRPGRLLMCDEYADGQKAIRDRFTWERYFAGLDVEVVVLGADSLETLRQTHGRYFKTARELAREMAGLASGQDRG